MTKFFSRIAALAAGLLLAAVVNADPYPSKPIKFLVAFAPGGGTDVIARIIGQHLADDWGRPVVVENRPGAGSNIGTRQVASAEPDGYTVLVTSTAFAINPSLYKNAGYDPIQSFVPIINAGYSPSILFVHPSVPVKTLQELIARGKAEPLSYASAGVGTVPFLTAEYLLNKMAGINITHIPFAGAGPALNAVIGGHVPVGAAAFATPGLTEWFASGKLRPIAITSATRSALQPDVPTALESGFPGMVDYTWIGFFAPANTPKEIVAKLNQAINRIIKVPAVQEQLTKIGFDWAPNSAEEFAAYILAEVNKWSTVVKSTGARAD
jgi:tripartite-type tricarboxylate transporter receptor subunit TctC